MNHIIVKVIALFVLFLLTMVTGLIPAFIDKRAKRTGPRRFSSRCHSGQRRSRILSYSNCFAGGVFFATCLLDLLPMVEEKYKTAFNQANIHTVFPVAEFTTCVGLFIILAVEQTVHFFHERSGKRSPFFQSPEDKEAYAPLLDDAVHNIDSVSTLGSNGLQDGDSFKTPRTKTAVRNNVVRRQGKNDNGNGEDLGSLRSCILLLALSLHSLFEGVALGLIQEVDRLTQVAVAVVIHKTIIAFSLGVNMVQHEMSVSAITKSCFLFSAMGPVGIGVGIAVVQSSSTFKAAISSAVLQGIANGSFLFVTFFEIFQKELSYAKGNRLLKVLFMIIGYSVVTGLLYYANIIEHASHPIKPKIRGNDTSTKDFFQVISK